MKMFYANSHSTPYIDKLLIYLFFSSFLSLSYLIIRDQSATYLPIYIGSLVLLSITKLKWDCNQYTIKSYLILITIIPIYQYFLYNIHGSYFTLGGDAQYYYEQAYEFAFFNGGTHGRFWLYIYMVGSYFKFVAHFNDTVNPTHFTLLTTVFASVTVRYYYGCICNIYGEFIAKKSTLLWMITPFFLYLGIGQLRDIYGYIAPAVLLYTLSKHYSFELKISDYIITALIVVYSSFIRIDITLFCTVLLISYSIVDTNNIKKMFMKCVFLTPILILFLVLLYNFDIISSQLNAENIEYRQTGFSSNAGTMASLKGSLLGIVILPILSYFTPLPVFILDRLYDFIHFYEMIFFFVWVYFSVVFILGLFSEFKNKFIMVFFLALVALLIILGSTTVGLYRQKIYVYPIIYAVILNYIYSGRFNNKFFIYNSGIFLISSLLVIFYFLRGL